MGNKVHLKNATSEAIYVITAPDLGWTIADLCVAAASLVNAGYGLTTLSKLKTLKTLRTLIRAGSMLSAILALPSKIATVVEAANIAKAFKRDATRIAPGQIVCINEKSTHNPLAYMSPSAVAAVAGGSDIAVLILSETNLMFASFSTNSDDSWIATDMSIVRAQYGTLSTPAPDEGEIPWEGAPASVSSTADGTLWTEDTPLAPEGWLTRHPVALHAAHDGLWGLYVGESGRTHFGRAPLHGGVLDQRTLAFNDGWRTAEAPALGALKGINPTAAMVARDGGVHIGYYEGDGRWQTRRLSPWSTREAVALAGGDGSFIVAHVGRSPSLYLAGVSAPDFAINFANRLPDAFNTTLTPALAEHNGGLFFAYVHTSGAAYVAWDTDEAARVRVFPGKTTRKPLGLASFNGRLYLSFVDDRGEAFVVSSADGKSWPEGHDRIFPGYITRLQVPLAASGGRLLASFTGVPDLSAWYSTARPRIRGGETVVLHSQCSGLALTRGARGAPLTMEPFADAPAQRWTIFELTDEAPGYYRIVAADDLTTVVAVAGASKEQSATVSTEGRSLGDRSQHWQIRWLEDGGFQLKARHSGQVLDVLAGATTPGTPAIQWSFHGGQNQRWRIGREVKSHEPVALISTRGTTVSAEPDALFRNRVSHIKGWETYKILRVDGPAGIAYGDEVALQAHDGKYMSADPSGGLKHHVAHIKAWETFTVVPRTGESRSGPLFMGEPFALRSHHGTYVMAHNDRLVDARASAQNIRTEWILATAAASTFAIDTIDPLDA